MGFIIRGSGKKFRVFALHLLCYGDVSQSNFYQTKIIGLCFSLQRNLLLNESESHNIKLLQVNLSNYELFAKDFLF